MSARAGHRQLVVVAGRMLAVLTAGEDARLFQLPQAGGQHLAGRPGVALDVVEAAHPEADLPHHQQRPAFPDQLQGVSDRADPGAVRAS
jgi:hypothetical protein